MHRLKSLLHRLVNRRWLHLRARWLLRSGRPGQARTLLRRAVTIAPASFNAHLLLARAFLAERRDLDALLEFGICYRLDPWRLLRQPLAPTMRDRIVQVAQHFDDTAARSLAPSGSGPLPGEWDDLLSGDDEPLEQAPPGSDFSDAAEYRRFCSLPPIGAEELATVDLDQLISQLSQAGPGERFDAGP